MAEKDYNVMTEAELLAEIALEYKAEKLDKIAKDELKVKKDAFYAAKDEAFQALGQVWQTAEDNNYTIPQ